MHGYAVIPTQMQRVGVGIRLLMRALVIQMLPTAAHPPKQAAQQGDRKDNYVQMQACESPPVGSAAGAAAGSVDGSTAAAAAAASSA
jgi:predicted lipid-binding transport protein (Tim44 family)